MACMHICIADSKIFATHFQNNLFIFANIISTGILHSMKNAKMKTKALSTNNRNF